MKKLERIYTLLCVIAVLGLSTTFVSCSSDDDEEVKPVDSSLKGDITEVVTLDAAVAYTLDGTLAIKDGGSLTIPAGTTIKAKKGFASYIIVERGGKIFANGTSSAPVTITSGEATPSTGDWGGLIINGKAPISGVTSGTEGMTEVDNNLLYGGTNAADNSGSLTYLILAYTGARSSADVEHNGLTLNAVGNGTKIENIYIPFGSDDGIEFFGGSVNVKNLLVVDADDDMFDFTQGYTGTLSNVYGVWSASYTSAEKDPRGIEADGNLDGAGPTHVDQSSFSVSGITIHNASAYVMEDAIKVRRGATAKISNALIVGGTTKDLIDLTDKKGDGEVATSIEYTVNGVTINGSDVKHPVAGNASINLSTNKSGADSALFSWTGYVFPSVK